jgi:hypothetical protein
MSFHHVRRYLEDLLCGNAAVGKCFQGHYIIMTNLNLD